MSIEFYWDTQDPQNVGPAYRDHESGESGEAEFVGWYRDGAPVSDAETVGYEVQHYFTGPDGAYTGPDCDGIYPAFRCGGKVTLVKEVKRPTGG